MKKLTEEWLKAAKDDLDVIARILPDILLTHIVAFHAQQCVEKVFKALLEEYEIETPKIHRLLTLYGKVESFIDIEIELSLLQTLDALYIDARYPGDLGLLPNGRPSTSDAVKFYDFAQTVFVNAPRWARNS